MKTLYESILDDDLTVRTDIIVDIFGTTKIVFKRLKYMNPMDFYLIRTAILIDQPFPNDYNLSKDEIIAFSNFIKHMHEKYGQKDIFLSAWSLYEGDWQMYTIFKGMDTMDKEFITSDLNLYMTSTPGKIDQWIMGIDKNAETSWFFCTLKSMSKVEKDTWLEIMKAIERYFN